jgi:hypothetical protein
LEGGHNNKSAGALLFTGLLEADHLFTTRKSTQNNIS